VVVGRPWLAGAPLRRPRAVGRNGVAGRVVTVAFGDVWPAGPVAVHLLLAVTQVGALWWIDRASRARVGGDRRRVPARSGDPAPGRRGPHQLQIAAKLTIGRETVKTHVGSILANLGARDRTHAVTMAHRRRLLDDQ
jgi:hypothetical protein